jgi:hypothetical protein
MKYDASSLARSQNITRVIKSRRLRLLKHAARMGERAGAYRVSAGKSEGKRPLGRSGRRWKDNIKINLRQVGSGHGLDPSGSG